MTRDDLIGKFFEVSIENLGDEGPKCCFSVHNDILGDLIVSNCQLRKLPDDTPIIFTGCVEFTIDSLQTEIHVFLKIDPNYPQKGILEIEGFA